MPRGARLDAPGTLHHIMVRGIEKRSIVSDDRDRKDFLSRMGALAVETQTIVYAWALMDNHAHILLRSGSFGLPTFMRRLLSGYAIFHNRRHGRSGHLFQNRYKSIVCEEDPYFMELVRYIHLNPLRAGLVDSLMALHDYQWCGHSAIMARQKNEFQDREYVLKWFGQKEGEALKAYCQFMEHGILLGRRPELVGGGLVRSLGGWSVVKGMRRNGLCEKADERILGSSEFVSEIIKDADEKVKYQTAGDDVMDIIERDISNICQKENVRPTALRAGSRKQPLPKIRKQLTAKFVGEYGLSLAETARQLGISTSAVAQIIRRDRKV